MRKVVARIFDYSLDGVISEESTEYCRDLPDDPAQVARTLKRDGEGDIVAHGGISFWHSLMRLDLVDEFRMTVFPYLAGKGRGLFDDQESSHQLELVSSAGYSNGTLELAYRPHR